jgi:hypothetical protein
LKNFNRNYGGALIELVFCIPFLAIILISIFFLGWAMINQQHVKDAARYASWRQVYNIGIVHGANEFDNWMGQELSDPNDFTAITTDNVNGLFFRQEGTGIAINYYDGDDIEFEQWVQAAQDISNYAGSFSSALIMDPPPGYDHFNHAVGAEVSSSFTTNVEYFKQFSGDIKSHHIRDGIEWRRRQADERHVTRIQFLQSLDDVLTTGGVMGEMMRGTYWHGW